MWGDSPSMRASRRRAAEAAAAGPVRHDLDRVAGRTASGGFNTAVLPTVRQKPLIGSLAPASKFTSPPFAQGATKTVSTDVLAGTLPVAGPAPPAPELRGAGPITATVPTTNTEEIGGVAKGGFAGGELGPPPPCAARGDEPCPPAPPPGSAFVPGGPDPRGCIDQVTGELVPPGAFPTPPLCLGLEGPTRLKNGVKCRNRPFCDEQTPLGVGAVVCGAGQQCGGCIRRRDDEGPDFVTEIGQGLREGAGLDPIPDDESETIVIGPPGSGAEEEGRQRRMRIVVGVVAVVVVLAIVMR